MLHVLRVPLTFHWEKPLLEEQLAERECLWLIVGVLRHSQREEQRTCRRRNPDSGGVNKRVACLILTFLFVLLCGQETLQVMAKGFFLVQWTQGCGPTVVPPGTPVSGGAHPRNVTEPHHVTSFALLEGSVSPFHFTTIREVFILCQHGLRHPVLVHKFCDLRALGQHVDLCEFTI